MRTAVLVALSLIAFASNSILCRLALAAHAIDATTFTAVRLASGAVMLAVLANKSLRPWPGTLRSAAALFLYAAPFSFAYLALGAGVGALVLFASVQLTMIGWGIANGERARAGVWLGLVVAFGGLVGLTVRGASAPDPVGAAAMVIAGIAWGAYSLRGRAAMARPLATTAANFVMTVPVVAVGLAIAGVTDHVQASARGLALAATSGALASGLGYSIWYAALPKLTAIRAGIVQLMVPIVAAAGGVLVLGEAISLRLVVTGAAIVGGVALAISSRP